MHDQKRIRNLRRMAEEVGPIMVEAVDALERHAYHRGLRDAALAMSESLQETVEYLGSEPPKSR